ncbi:TadE/TadG family type IV pilus assembly protein [Azohydromonas australica]|uniref:TadE/TadG family type IV pilus assembly protein n=1 Tax=Azohydromonas australica TaxID=364039 RepID=UPI0004038B87|nr:TadE/TadG family type IV pilus assembly protein [Azohydromonas australica]
MRRLPARRQRGAMAVDFALTVSVLLMALIGAMEVGRLLWTWNAAAEATRLGARLAAVCTRDDADIKTRMRERLPALTNDQIVLDYINPGGVGACNDTNCRLVHVELQGFRHELLVPLPTALGSIEIPASVTLPREVFNSANQPACS